MYTGEESWETDDAVVATRRITRQGTRRVAEFAFDYAVRHGRKKAAGGGRLEKNHLDSCHSSSFCGPVCPGAIKVYTAVWG